MPPASPPRPWALLAERLFADGRTPARKVLRWAMLFLWSAFLFVALFVPWFRLAFFWTLGLALAACALITAFAAGRFLRGLWTGHHIRRHGHREQGTVVGFDLLWINAPGYLGCTLRIATDSGELVVATTRISDLDHVARGDRVTLLLHPGYPGQSRLLDYP